MGHCWPGNLCCMHYTEHLQVTPAEKQRTVQCMRPGGQSRLIYCYPRSELLIDRQQDFETVGWFVDVSWHF